jgi:hypothetical protein
MRGISWLTRPLAVRKCSLYEIVGKQTSLRKGGVGADNAVSKNNADYEIGLCAARASSIIHFNF